MSKSIAAALLAGVLGAAPLLAAEAAECVGNLDRRGLIIIAPGRAAPTPCEGEATILRAGETMGKPAAPPVSSGVAPMQDGRHDLRQGNLGMLAAPPSESAGHPGSSPATVGGMATGIHRFAVGETRSRGGEDGSLDIERFVTHRNLRPFATGDLGPFTTGSLAPFTTGSFGADIADLDMMSDAARKHEMIRRRP
jgi:hypothetical protein